MSAKRTAFGTFGGSLKGKSASDLAEHVSKAALDAASIKPEKIDHVVFGSVIPSSKDAPYLARVVSLRVGILESFNHILLEILGIPLEKPAVTVNRLCGSGFEVCQLFKRVI